MIKHLTIALALLTPIPVSAHDVNADLFAKTIELCQTDMIQYHKGDKTWLERTIAKLKQEDQNYIFITCSAYMKGLADGVALRKQA